MSDNTAHTYIIGYYADGDLEGEPDHVYEYAAKYMKSDAALRHAAFLSRGTTDSYQQYTKILQTVKIDGGANGNA